MLFLKYETTIANTVEDEQVKLRVTERVGLDPIRNATCKIINTSKISITYTLLYTKPKIMIRETMITT